MVGHGLRVPLSVYRLPEGVDYLVVDNGESQQGSRLGDVLGPRVIVMTIDSEGICNLFIDNKAYADATANTPTEEQDAHPLPPDIPYEERVPDHDEYGDLGEKGAEEVEQRMAEELDRQLR